MRGLAKILLSQARFDEAVEAYTLIADAIPEDAAAHYDLAGALAFIRRYAEAIDAVERAIALDDSDARFYELAAVSHQQLSQFSEAFEATRRGAELGDIKAMYTLAGMYEHGRGTESSDPHARRWLERAADGGHLGAMDAMIRVYRDGLYGQPRNLERAAEWQARLDAELASD